MATATTQSASVPPKPARLESTGALSVAATRASVASAPVKGAPNFINLPPPAPHFNPAKIEIPPTSPLGANTGVLSSDDEDQQRAEEMVFSQAVLRTGWLWKKGGRTLKMWKRRWFVLRRDCFSYYQDNQEIEARKVVLTTDISGIAYKDISHKPHVCFWVGPKEIHLQARSVDDAKEWVRKLKLAVHGPDSVQPSPIESSAAGGTMPELTSPRRMPTSSSMPRITSPQDLPAPGAGIYENGYRSRKSSAAELGPLPQSALAEEDYMSPGEFSDNDLQLTTSGEHPDVSAIDVQPPLQRSDSPTSGPDVQNGGIPTSFTLRAPDVGDKVVAQGWLRRRHVRTGRWSKKVWVVLRSNGLYVYPEKDEYKAMLVLPFKREIIDVSELEPLTIGKGKHSRYCFQVITKTRALRFSCETEEELDRWVGALKSRIVHTLT